MPQFTPLSTADISAVFAALKLETVEQREAMLAQGRTKEMAKVRVDKEFRTFIGTTTEPPKEPAADDARME